MKVDIGACALCGAKNSKYVATCYKCGAPLPWAPNYVAPNPAKPAPAATPTPPSPTPTPTPVTPKPKTPAPPSKTVASPPLDLSAFEDKKAGSSLAATLQRSVAVPTWGIAAGVAGSFILGLLLGRATGGGNEAPAQVVVPTPVPTVAAAPVATVLPSPLPTATPVPTVAATTAPAVPSLTPVSSAPGAVAPGAVAPNPAASNPAASNPASGAPANLTFDNVFLNTHQGTPEQQASYWNGIVNSRVNWRGVIVSAGTTPTGPVTLRSGAGTAAANVVVNLDAANGQILAGLKPNQAVEVEGNLQSYTADTFVLGSGLIKP